MTDHPRAERPTVVLSLCHQKETIAKVRKPSLGHDAGGDLRYLARLERIPGYSDPSDFVRYLDCDDATATFALENFNLDDLASMARELESDAREASSKVISPWIQGCVSQKISPHDFESDQVIFVEGVNK